MSDLDRSEEYYRKRAFLKDNDVPVQKEIRCRLGDDLAKVLFETCMPSLKPYLGLTPTLTGPGDELWVSPSDILIGKIRLKPPLTDKYIKSLTHQGILDIGSVVEKKFENEKQINIQRAVAENEELIKYLAEKEKQRAIIEAKDEEQAKYEMIIENLKLDFEQTLQKELQLLEEKLEFEKEQAVEAGKEEVEQIMQDRMELAILETVQRLAEHFATELLKQSKKLHEHFWFHIKEEKQKLKQAVKAEKLRSKQMLEKLRHELQCENIANVMYVLAMERHRCSCEIKQIKYNYETKLAEINKELVVRQEKLQKLTLENEENTRKILAREQYLYEIIKQFQKFIYFVLKAVPTQAEYLLNVEKLMIFELTKAVLNSKPELFDINNPLNVIKSPDNETSSVSSHSEREMGLVAPDFHNCNNMAAVVDSCHTLFSNQDLPMFVFNDMTYIREDFRNMISQGLQISNSNELWTRELENLANSLQPDVAVDTPLISDISVTPCSQSKVSKSLQSDASSKQVCSNEELLVKSSDKVLQTLYDSNEDNIEIVFKKFSNIKDSLSVTAERLKPQKKFVTKSKLNKPKYHCRYAPNLGTENAPCFKPTAVDTKFDSHVDSLILLAKKSATWKAPSLKDVFVKNKSSKIEMAVDSLILLRSKESFKCKSKESILEKILWHSKNINTGGIQPENQLKSVQLSHFEVIPDNIKKKNSVVSFHVMPKIIPTDDCISEEQLIKKFGSDILNKPTQTSVIGDRFGTEHLQDQDEFTMKRVHSFLSIFRKHPSLRKLFTEVSRK